VVSHVAQRGAPVTSTPTTATRRTHGGTPKVRLEAVHHAYRDVKVLDGVSLELAAGELVTIVGPSGCGKSTIFSILTGATAPVSGSVLVDGAPLGGAGGRFAVMPQTDALLPWRRVIDNVTLGLEVQGLSRREARARVSPLLETFGLNEFARAYPFQLSGGMRQRAALLRTVVQDRSVMLLDEPFGALDALTRTDMQTWLESVWGTFGASVLLITHDIREAVFLSDRVYVLSPRPARVVAEVTVPLARPRRLEDVGTPAFVDTEAELRQILSAVRNHGA
jgi:ABC-type nitrate/sulfonate/bicarbonate transport system ATPase subunit